MPPKGSRPLTYALLGGASFISICGTWLGYALLPRMSEMHPQLLLASSPGVVSLISTWGTASLETAFGILAASRMVKVGLGYACGQVAYQGLGATRGPSQAHRWLERYLPRQASTLAALIAPSYATAFLLGSFEKRHLNFLWLAVGVIATQAVWFGFLIAHQDQVEAAGKAIQAIGTGITVLTVALGLLVRYVYNLWRKSVGRPRR